MEHLQAGGWVAETQFPTCSVCKAEVWGRGSLESPDTRGLPEEPQNMLFPVKCICDAGAETLFLLWMPCDFQWPQVMQILVLNFIYKLGQVHEDQKERGGRRPRMSGKTSP